MLRLLTCFDFARFFQKRGEYSQYSWHLCIRCHHVPLFTVVSEETLPEKGIRGAGGPSSGEDVIGICLAEMQHLREGRLSCLFHWYRERRAQFWVPIILFGYSGFALNLF